MNDYKEIFESMAIEQLQEISEILEQVKKRKKENYFKDETEKIINILRSFKEKFPYSCMDIDTHCYNCGEDNTINLLEYINEIDFVL